MEPEVYLGTKPPGTPWSRKSRGLAEGLSLYEDSINEFGIPLRQATDPEMDGWYEIKDDEVDYAVAAMEEYRKNKKDAEPGVRLQVVNTRVQDAERPAEALPPTRRGEATLDEVEDGLPTRE